MEFDKDLLARQEAREAAKISGQAQKELCSMSQDQLDAIVETIGETFSREACRLAELAVEETGFGNVPDKTAKNQFASHRVAQALRE